MKVENLEFESVERVCGFGHIGLMVGLQISKQDIL